MTIFYPDISSFQSGIDLKGALAACCKVTEGSTYVNPDYARAKANAAKRGTFFMAYHFLHAGNAPAQARWAFQHAGKTPLMLDVEPTAFGVRARRSNIFLMPETASRPTIADVIEFVAVYRSLGGIIHLLYLPHWYWQEIGSPLLSTAVSKAGLVIVSSAYTAYTDGNGGTGWQPYGGVHPTVWQYTDRLAFNGFSVDFNAFRGHYAGKQDAASVKDCLAELESIAKTGKFPAPPKPPADPDATNPVTGLKVEARYTQADLSWHAAANATGYRVIVWQKRKLLPLRKRVQTVNVADNKVTLTHLKDNTAYEVTVLALPASPSAEANRASASFRTI